MERRRELGDRGRSSRKQAGREGGGTVAACAAAVISAAARFSGEEEEEEEERVCCFKGGVWKKRRKGDTIGHREGKERKGAPGQHRNSCSCSSLHVRGEQGDRERRNLPAGLLLLHFLVFCFIFHSTDKEQKGGFV